MGWVINMIRAEVKSRIKYFSKLAEKYDYKGGWIVYKITEQYGRLTQAEWDFIGELLGWSEVIATIKYNTQESLSWQRNQTEAIEIELEKATWKSSLSIN